MSEYASSCGNENARAQILAFPNYADLMAREFKYHRSCYQDICRPKKLHKTNPAENSISKLKQYVVIKNGHIVKVKDIADRYKSFLLDEEVDSSGHDTRAVKNLLEKLFGTQLYFIQKNPGTPTFVFSENIREE